MVATPLQETGGLSPYNPLVVALTIVAAAGAIGAVFIYREARGTHSMDDRGSFAWLFGLLGGDLLGDGRRRRRTDVAGDAPRPGVPGQTYLLYLIAALVAVMAALALVIAFEAHYGHIVGVVTG